MTDPLAGKRTAIADGELAVLTWPDDGSGCPVEVDQVFPLRRAAIQITETRRTKGKGGFYWVAHFELFRTDTDKVRLLNRRGDGYTANPREAMAGTGEEHGSTTIVSTEPLDLAANEYQRPPEPEAVPKHEIANYSGSKLARARYEAQMAEDRLALDELPIAVRMRRLEIAAEEGAPVGRNLRRIKAQLAEAELKAGLRRAA